MFQSELLSDILYQTEWFKFETELQKDIMLVMLRARRPSLLTAGPLRDMSYQTIVLVRVIISKIKFFPNYIFFTDCKNLVFLHGTYATNIVKYMTYSQCSVDTY